MENNLAANIKAFRKERKLTQEQLAEVLGVTTGAVYKWESGLSIPELGLLMDMADFFDTSVDVLIGYRVRENHIASVTKRIAEYCRNRSIRIPSMRCMPAPMSILSSGRRITINPKRGGRYSCLNRRFF